MNKEERKAFLESEKSVALEAFEKSEIEHKKKIDSKRAELVEANKSQAWLNFTQLGFFQAIRRWWNRFSHLHPVASKWIYEIGFFFIFSNFFMNFILLFFLLKILNPLCFFILI